MADSQAVADPLASLPIPPLGSSIFSDDLTLPDDFFAFDDEDFDITFDDIHLPSDTEEFFNSTFNPSNPIDLSSSDPEFNDFVSDPETVVAESGCLSGHPGSDVSGFLNIPSPDNSGKGFVEEIVRVLDNPSPESRNENPVSSQGSGNCGSAGSDAAMSCPSPDSGNSVVDQKVKRESRSNFVLKRKKENSDGNSESRTIKCRRSNETSETTENSNQVNQNDEKKKARLIRNRESAQLSRQRKKHYVEELEDKVRAMHSTIQDLNARITYFAAENATLKQQMVASGGAVCSPPVMYPPHPGMAPMGYPWMPCPPYVVKSQGSQVPLVPIPRLKPQQPASLQKAKKVDVKKTEGTTKTKTKTKKVASISFLGLLLFIVLFGGLVPMMDVKFGGVTDGDYTGGSNDYRFYDQQHPGSVLMGDDHVNGTNHRTGIGSGKAHEHNASEPLVASLYVPRNDKLVKIDGNLIIHSVLASEKAMASREEQGMTKKEDNDLAVALDLVPAISIPAVGRNSGRQPHMYRTSSDRQRVLSSDKENLKSKPADGKLQQWFREGLAGKEEKKDFVPIVEKCYDKYFANPNKKWNSAEFYHAVCETVEEINKMLGSTQFHVPKTSTLEQAYHNHHKGKEKSLSKEEFQRIMQDVIMDSGVTGLGIKDIFLFIFGIPIATTFIKQRAAPNAIPNDVFIPAVTSASVFLLTKLNKI